jgi:hypothetical protein
MKTIGEVTKGKPLFPNWEIDYLAQMVEEALDLEWLAEELFPSSKRKVSFSHRT